MRIDGKRADGALLVILDGGLACITRGNLSSPALEEVELRPHGPWTPTDSSLAARRAMSLHLQRTRTVPLHQLAKVLSLQDAPVAEAEAPVADAAMLKQAAAEHQTAATAADLDIDAMQEDADELAAEALEMSEAAETAEEHRAASEALESAAAAQEAVDKLRVAPTIVPPMGTPEFDAYIEAEVAKRMGAPEAVAVTPEAVVVKP